MQLSSVRGASFLAVVWVVVVSGCVSLGTYEKNMRACQGLTEENAALEKEVAALRQKSQDAEQTKAELEEQITDIQQTYDTLIVDLKEYMSEGVVGVTMNGGELTVSMGNKVLFKSGEAALHEEGKKVLKQVAKSLKNNTSHNIHVQGHSDGMLITGLLKKKYPTNWELSSARAASVVRFLQFGGSLSPKRLVLMAYAQYKPVASNKTKKGRQQNRRVEISLVKKGS